LQSNTLRALEFGHCRQRRRPVSPIVPDGDTDRRGLREANPCGTFHETDPDCWTEGLFSTGIGSRHGPPSLRVARDPAEGGHFGATATIGLYRGLRDAGSGAAWAKFPTIPYIWPIMMPARRYLLLNVARAQIGPDVGQKTGQSVHSRSLTLKTSVEQIGRFFRIFCPRSLLSGWRTSGWPHSGGTGSLSGAGSFGIRIS
jgi:hypothetical protein